MRDERSRMNMVDVNTGLEEQRESDTNNSPGNVIDINAILLGDPCPRPDVDSNLVDLADGRVDIHCL